MCLGKLIKGKAAVPSMCPGRGTFLPQEWHHTGLCTLVAWASWHWAEDFHLMVGESCSVIASAPLWSLWHPCGRLVQEARLAGDSPSFSFRKKFPSASSLNHDNWERCRLWWSCQSASPLNRWKTSEIRASTEIWETTVPVKWAFSFQEGKLV